MELSAATFLALGGFVFVSRHLHQSHKSPKIWSYSFLNESNMLDRQATFLSGIVLINGLSQVLRLKRQSDACFQPMKCLLWTQADGNLSCRQIMIRCRAQASWRYSGM